jgi:hypothetical protein
MVASWVGQFRVVRWVALALGAVAALVAGGVAQAETEGTRVILSYVPVVSNWGPVEANGVVVYSLAEGDVRADFVGLPVLGDNERYELWLGKSDAEAVYSLARFNASISGTTLIDALLPEAIPDDSWDELYLTVEPEPDDDALPSGTFSIVGGVPGTVAETQQFPPVMPETGQAGATEDDVAVASTLVIAAGAAGVMALIVSAAVLARERRGMVQARVMTEERRG